MRHSREEGLPREDNITLVPRFVVFLGFLGLKVHLLSLDL